MKEKIITVIGSINYDIIFKQKSFPQIGETLTADSVTFSGGGKGANQAVQCAKLGVRTYMAGCIGNDSFGSQLKDQLEGFGVNTQHVVTMQGNTGLGVVNALENGKLMATISTGANYQIQREHIDRLDDLLRKSSIVILQMEIPIEILEYAIEKADAHGCYILLNAAPARAISDKALSMVDCLVVNEPEASYFCQQSIVDVETAVEHSGKLQSRIRGLLIITLGENGSLLHDGKNIVQIQAKKVNAIESTGAGDSYIGAFASQILQGVGVAEAAEFAAAAGAYTVTGIGAQESMPTKDALKDFLKKIES